MLMCNSRKFLYDYCKAISTIAKKVVAKVIVEVQNAFIEGRFILDGVHISNETMEFLKKSKRKGLIFKVDFEKSYDSIEWAAEGLNALMKEALNSNIFNGVRVGADGVMCFEEVAGLKNLHKSKLYGVGVETNELERMTCFMRCGVGELSSYWGEYEESVGVE
ncbi:hypothetical protein Tco_0709307 [Tanacetum coccineum]